MGLFKRLFKQNKKITAYTEMGNFTMLNPQFKSNTWGAQIEGVSYIIGGDENGPNLKAIAFLKGIDSVLNRLHVQLTQRLLNYIQETDPDIVFDSWKQNFALRTIVVRDVTKSKILWQIRFVENTDEFQYTVYLDNEEVTYIEVDLNKVTSKSV